MWFSFYAPYFTAWTQASKTPAEISEKQWQEILVAVSDEQWDKAFQLASQSKDQMKADDERLPRLRYVYLYSAAGRVSSGAMSFDELERLVKEFNGKEIVFPYRPIMVDCHGDFNFICATQQAKDRMIVAASNKAGTTIHAFEYVQLKEEFDAASHRGENASLAGVIDSIKVNPNKSRLLVMRIYVIGGYVMLMRKPQVAVSTQATTACSLSASLSLLDVPCLNSSSSS